MDIVLLRVCEPPDTPPYYYAPVLPDTSVNWGEYMQRETAGCKQVASEYLSGIEKQFKDTGVKLRSEVLTGKAAEEIVDYANRDPFHLIVMATHGRSGLSRWVYGSVTENVLSGVSSPVLLVRTN